MSSGKVHLIHDNHNRPFTVHIQGYIVTVFRNIDGAPHKKVYEAIADKIFIGKKSPDGGYDGLPAKEAVGNTILLHVGDKYVFIGEEIYEFLPVEGDTIVKYYSNIGPNDVPYPYAIGETHIYILLEDKVAVEKSYFSLHAPIYDQYYFESRILTDMHNNPSAFSDTDKEIATARIAELHRKTTKLRTKQIEKRR